MKIALFYVDRINNMGDNLLQEATEYLLKTIEPGIEVRRLSFAPGGARFLKRHFVRWSVSNAIRVAIRALPDGEGKWRIKNLAYRLRLKNYYDNEIKDADAAIYAVGALKYRTQDFSHLYDFINGELAKRGIPVLMSAMSIAEPDAADWRYHQLVRAVNSPSVRMVTTRDGQEGQELLRQSYVSRKGILTDYVGDAALWIPECYGIKKAPGADTVGIGLVRKGIYNDYGTDFSGEHLLKVYEELLLELDRRGQKWVLFSNGIEEDYEVGAELLRRMGRTLGALLPRPQNAHDYVKTVSGFKAVFGGRMHACVTAFALDIPVVGLLWDAKLACFSKTMGIGDFFLTAPELARGGGKLVADKMEAAAIGADSVKNRELYKERTCEALREFLASLPQQCGKNF